MPGLTGRQLELRLLAQVQPYLWFVGMILFSFTTHVAGLAVVLVIIAYAIPLNDLLQLERFGSSGFSPF